MNQVISASFAKTSLVGVSLAAKSLKFCGKITEIKKSIISKYYNFRNDIPVVIKADK